MGATVKPLQDYLSLWGLEDPHPLVSTATSRVYRCRRREPSGTATSCILKLLTSTGMRDESAGAIALEAFAGHGAVRLLTWDEHAHLLEDAGDKSLMVVVQESGDTAAARILAQVMLQLHEAPVREGLVPLAERCRALTTAGDLPSPLQSLCAQARKVLLDLERTSPAGVVLHGDLHHENLLVSPRGPLAIDPKGLWGDPAYDGANLFLNPGGTAIVREDPRRISQLAAVLHEVTGQPLPRLLAWGFVHACLSACWSLEDGDEPSGAVAVATAIAVGFNLRPGQH